eukprot:SM000023S07701  [mRNA]  locus=s23:1064346:1069362:- [translate_table: standard]
MPAPHLAPARDRTTICSATNSFLDAVAAAEPMATTAFSTGCGPPDENGSSCCNAAAMAALDRQGAGGGGRAALEDLAANRLAGAVALPSPKPPAPGPALHPAAARCPPQPECGTPRPARTVASTLALRRHLASPAAVDHLHSLYLDDSSGAAAEGLRRGLRPAAAASAAVVDHMQELLHEPVILAIPAPEPPAAYPGQRDSVQALLGGPADGGTALPPLTPRRARAVPSSPAAVDHVQQLLTGGGDGGGESKARRARPTGEGANLLGFWRLDLGAVDGNGDAGSVHRATRRPLAAAAMDSLHSILHGGNAGDVPPAPPPSQRTPRRPAECMAAVDHVHALLQSGGRCESEGASPTQLAQRQNQAACAAAHDAVRGIVDEFSAEPTLPTPRQRSHCPSPAAVDHVQSLFCSHGGDADEIGVAQRRLDVARPAAMASVDHVQALLQSAPPAEAAQRQAPPSYPWAKDHLASILHGDDGGTGGGFLQRRTRGGRAAAEEDNVRAYFLELAESATAAAAEEALSMAAPPPPTDSFGANGDGKSTTEAISERLGDEPGAELRPLPPVSPGLAGRGSPPALDDESASPPGTSDGCMGGTSEACTTSAAVTVVVAGDVAAPPAPAPFSPVRWFPRAKRESYLERKIRLLQEQDAAAAGPLDEALEKGRRRTGLVEREKIAAAEAAVAATAARRAALIEVAWCCILGAAGVVLPDAKVLTDKREQEALAATARAEALGVALPLPPQKRSSCGSLLINSSSTWLSQLPAAAMSRSMDLKDAASLSVDTTHTVEKDVVIAVQAALRKVVNIAGKVGLTGQGPVASAAALGVAEALSDNVVEAEATVVVAGCQAAESAVGAAALELSDASLEHGEQSVAGQNATETEAAAAVPELCNSSLDDEPPVAGQEAFELAVVRATTELNGTALEQTVAGHQNTATLAAVATAAGLGQSMHNDELPVAGQEDTDIAPELSEASLIDKAPKAGQDEAKSLPVATGMESQTGIEQPVPGQEEAAAEGDGNTSTDHCCPGDGIEVTAAESVAVLEVVEEAHTVAVAEVGSESRSEALHTPEAAITERDGKQSMQEMQDASVQVEVNKRSEGVETGAEAVASEPQSSETPSPDAANMPLGAAVVAVEQAEEEDPLVVTMAERLRGLEAGQLAAVAAVVSTRAAVAGLLADLQVRAAAAEAPKRSDGNGAGGDERCGLGDILVKRVSRLEAERAAAAAAEQQWLQGSRKGLPAASGTSGKGPPAAAGSFGDNLVKHRSRLEREVAAARAAAASSDAVLQQSRLAMDKGGLTKQAALGGAAVGAVVAASAADGGGSLGDVLVKRKSKLQLEVERARAAELVAREAAAVVAGANGSPVIMTEAAQRARAAGGSGLGDGAVRRKSRLEAEIEQAKAAEGRARDQ